MSLLKIDSKAEKQNVANYTRESTTSDEEVTSSSMPDGGVRAWSVVFGVYVVLYSCDRIAPHLACVPRSFLMQVSTFG